MACLNNDDVLSWGHTVDATVTAIDRLINHLEQLSREAWRQDPSTRKGLYGMARSVYSLASFHAGVLGEIQLLEHQSLQTLQSAYEAKVLDFQRASGW